MNLSLEGKNAIICGSSQGIGYAIAQELALMGANCILLARAEENLKLAVGELDISIRQLHSYRAIDFNNHDELRKLLSEITAEKPVHILINNSGGPAAGPIVAATEEQFLQAFNQHLLTNHLLTIALLEGMKTEGYGRIVNVISTSVKIPLKNLGVSNTIRGAVASWAKTMSNELAQFGITVNNVLPGYTRTQRLDSLVENIAGKKGVPAQEVEREMLEEIPAKRFGDAAEIAALAAFLATPAAAYINGTSIPVDGGRTGSI
ncbi:SDR family oxidoreductase [Flavisolibacter ginsenosidimutans]|uniref:SDR family oxidoreductase n=1 Tax=Flavisolibacter ginsenosidimutans TaxID=661481 RepID=A0A5B8UF77_9BACT|nr:SDR family oxidoreductase [Flavisolibacter ginsenosidimutans]QEC55158.1 SDR family oxidoreductase [Flavisolibacter ginsenosidimutans]